MVLHLMVEMINEVIRIDYNNFSFEILPVILKTLEAMVEDDLNEDFEKQCSYLIRECAENRSDLNDRVLKALLKTKILLHEL